MNNAIARVVTASIVLGMICAGWIPRLTYAADENIGQAVYFGETIMKDYHPTSELVTDEHHIDRARYPVIDVHTHFSLDVDREKMLKAMDDLGVRRVVNLSGGNGEYLDKMLKKFYEPYPDRFAIFYNIDFTTIDEPRFGERTAALIREAHSKGLKGLKVFKSLGLTTKDSKGQLIRLDDRRLDPVWDMLAELGMPVLMHTADPSAFFKPIDKDNERWLQLARHPDWSFYGDQFPSRAELFAQRERVLQRHPDLKLIGAHMGSYADDLKQAEAMLDKYPNFYIEISGRVSALGRQPYSARDLLMKYPDRVMYGTDRYPGRPDQPRYRIYYRFLETADQHFDYYDHPFPPTGEWKIYGINLDDELLEKIYYKNAERVLGY